MASLKSSTLAFLVLAVVLALYSSAAPRPGGWTPIKDLADPAVVTVAKFAVAEQNRKPNTSELKLVSIIKGETQVVAGLNYKLVIAADLTGGNALDKYEAVVYQKAGGKVLKLVSFKKFVQN